MRIFIDLDCVLADFVSSAALAHRVPLETLMKVWPPGEYGMNRPLTHARRQLNAVDKMMPPNWVMGEDEFWAPIDRYGERFWENLSVLPWARQLMEIVNQFADLGGSDWWVVTAPSRHPGCIPGKKRWCNRFFQEPYFPRMIPLTAKYLLANPTAVLIDDHEHNVQQFAQAGGYGILFPQHHNRLHDFKDHPLNGVRKSLNQLAKILGQGTAVGYPADEGEPLSCLVEPQRK